MERHPPITELKPYDVLLGRGTGSSQYIGNQRFRDLINERKAEYNGTGKHKDKQQISQDVRDRVHELGGRFLRRIADDDDSGETKIDCCTSVQEDTWYEVNGKEALEKCKQTLREKRATPPPPRSVVSAASSNVAGSNSNTLFFPPIFAASLPDSRNGSIHPTTAAATGGALSSSSSSNVTESVVSSSTTAMNLWALQSAMLSASAASANENAQRTAKYPSSLSLPVCQLQTAVLPSLHQLVSNDGATSISTIPMAMASSSSLRPDCTISSLSSLAAAGRKRRALQQDVLSPSSSSSFDGGGNSLESSLQSDELPQQQSNNCYSCARSSNHGSAASLATGSYASSSSVVPKQASLLSPTSTTTATITTTTAAVTKTPSSSSPATATIAQSEDDEVSEFLLSVLALSGRTKFTEEEELDERASMTNEERARVLSDLFGKYCNTGVAVPSAHHESKRAKQDLDERSIAFLVDQMRVEVNKIPNAEKVELVEAQQSCRAEEFSKERLESFLRCVGMDVQMAARRFANYWKCRKEVFGPEKYLLPMTLSGAVRDDLVALETGVFCLLPRLDAAGRRVLYMDPSRHTREGYTSDSLLRAMWYVMEVASQGNTDMRSTVVQIVWFRNFTIWDYDRVYEHLEYFQINALPVRFAALHACCPASLVVRVVKPIMFAAKDKESRSRTLLHNVEYSEIVNVMASYGITRDMLPVEMGGDLQFDQREWIADRRAVELEEI